MKLRCCPIIRVSGEAQEKRKSSLELQTKNIKLYVESMGGIIPKDCWKYSGQEHSTPGFERKKFDQMLKDSSKDKFDCVIIDDMSRWSREVVKSVQAFEVLRNNGIRFFIRQAEQDLFEPESDVVRKMTTVMHEFSAMQNILKSINVRIEKAKKGHPASGYKPVGRLFDKKTKVWSVDDEVQNKMIWAAESYIDGMPIDEVVKQVSGFNSGRLLRNALVKNSGDSYTQKINVAKFNIDFEVETKIPRLLEDTLIEAVKERARENKKYNGGANKREYLFSNIIYCGNCGEPLSGHSARPEHRDKAYRYYYKKGHECYRTINADMIEESIMVHVYSAFGDIESIEKSLDMVGAPSKNKRDALQTELKTIKKELDKINDGKEKILKQIMEGHLSGSDVKKWMDKLKLQESRKIDRQKNIKMKLKSIPTIEENETKKQLLKQISMDVFKSESHFKDMSFDDKQKMLRALFNGSDADGRQYGIYLKRDNDQWTYEIYGNLNLIDNTGSLPMPESLKKHLMGMENDVSTNVTHNGNEPTSNSLWISIKP